MDAKTIDQETNLALAAGLASGAMGLVFGTPGEAAAVAAIASLGSRLFKDINSSQLNRQQRRAVGAMVITAAVFALGRNNRFRISGETAASAIAGNLVSHLVLHDKIKTFEGNDKYRSHLFLAAVAAKIMAGQGTPLLDDMLGNGFLILTATHLAAQQAKHQVKNENRWMVELVGLAAPLLLKQNSGWTGLPTTAEQLYNSLLVIGATNILVN